MNFLKSIKNAFHSPTSSTSVSPTGSPTRSMVQPSPIRNTHLPKPPQPEKSLSFDSHAFVLSRRSSSMSLKGGMENNNNTTNNIVPNSVPNTMTNSGFSMYDYILCRICEEMIPSHELDVHSEICAITTDYAIKLQECDGRLRRLVGDVAKRKAEILVRGVVQFFIYLIYPFMEKLFVNFFQERNTPYQDYYNVKDAEVMEEIGFK